MSINPGVLNPYNANYIKLEPVLLNAFRYNLALNTCKAELSQNAAD